MATYTGIKEILTEFKNRMIKTKVNSATNADEATHATNADSATSATSADSATNADTVDNYHVGTTYPALVPVTACSLGSTSGYIKLGNGLIVQWGQGTANGSTGVMCSFSLSFSYAPRVFLTSNISQENTTDNLIVSSVGKTSFTAKYHNHSCVFFWLAIGY